MSILLMTVMLSSWLAPPEFAQQEQSTIDQLAVQQQEEIIKLSGQVLKLKGQVETQRLQNTYFKIMFLRPTLKPEIAKSIARHALDQAEKNGIDVDLLLALIRVESYFDPKAVSRTGARGLSQILLGYWKDDCKLNKSNMYDVEANIACGVLVFMTYYQKYNDVTLALTSYNAGDQVVDYLLQHRKRINYGYAKSIKYYYQQLKSVELPFQTDREQKPLIGF